MALFYAEKKHSVLHFDAPEDWQALFAVCNGWLREKDCRTLQAYFAERAHSVLIEKVYHDKDYRDTYYNFYAKKFPAYPARCIRLHFFGTKIDQLKIYELDRDAESRDAYLGYSVIRPTRVRTIGRSVFDPRKLKILPEDAYCCCAEFDTHVLGNKFHVRGFPYISQDSDVTVCAHAATWMICRYFTEKYSDYAEARPFQLTQLTHDYSYGRIVPSKGLSMQQVAEVFANFGLYPLIYRREKGKDEMFERLLYYYVESGIPIVAGVTREDIGHVMILFGHVMDVKGITHDDPKPVVKTADHVGGFVATDDNYLPYQMLWRNGPTDVGHDSVQKISDVHSFVVPLYEKIFLEAEYAERHFDNWLGRSGVFDPFDFGLVENDLVTRVFLTSSRSYKKFKARNKIGTLVDSVYREINLPKFIWVCELSTRAQYGQQQIDGEIILDATASRRDTLSLILMHLPKLLILNDRDSMADEKLDLQPSEDQKLRKSRFSIMKLPDRPAYGTFVSNLERCDES